MSRERTVAVEPAPLEDIRAEAERLARAAVEGGLELRLMGGTAVYVTSPAARRPPLARTYGDLDFVVSSRDKKAAGAFLEAAVVIDAHLVLTSLADVIVDREAPGASRPTSTIRS